MMRTMSACCFTVSLKSSALGMDGLMLPTSDTYPFGIVSHGGPDGNIPELDCCGEAVELWRYPLTLEENTPEPGTLPLLHPQLHHGRPTAALILRRLGHRLHVGMLLQRLPQRFAEDAHATAMDDAH